MVVGDENLGTEGIGTSHRGMGSDAGVASKDQAGAINNQAFQTLLVEPVAFGAGWDAKADPGAQGAQCFHQQGGGRLTIGVKISPDGDRLVVLDGLAQALDCAG